MPPDHDVFQSGHFCKQADVLKRTGDTSFGYFMHRGRLVRISSQLETAGVRCVQTGNHIKESSFARAIRTYQAIHLTALNGHAHIIQRLQAAKAFRYTLHIQHRCTHADLLSAGSALPCSGAGHKPRGRHSMMRIMANAIKSWRSMAASNRPPVSSCNGLAT